MNFYFLDVQATGIADINEVQDHDRFEELVDCVRLTRGARQKLDCMGRLDRYCLNNPRLFDSVQRPGARGASIAASKYHTREALFCSDISGQCMRATLPNAINATKCENAEGDAKHLLCIGRVAFPFSIRLRVGSSQSRGASNWQRLKFRCPSNLTTG